MFLLKRDQDEETGDATCHRARIKGMLGLYRELSDPKDYKQVASCCVHEEALKRPHVNDSNCWCEPFVEFDTDFVTVWRHRRMQ
jgi:hypothetical protein